MRPEQRELLRKSALSILAESPAAAFTVSVLHARLKRQCPDIPFDEHDVAEAIALLEGLFLVRAIQSPLGSTLSYQISAQGTLFHERNP
jgi:hypothetical protein